MLSRLYYFFLFCSSSRIFFYKASKSFFDSVLFLFNPLPLLTKVKLLFFSTSTIQSEDSVSIISIAFTNYICLVLILSISLSPAFLFLLAFSFICFSSWRRVTYHIRADLNVLVNLDQPICYHCFYRNICIQNSIIGVGTMFDRCLTVTSWLK